MVAGFELPDKGKIMFEGIEVTSPGPERGMVFQDYGLFPWLTVRKNIEFGLKESGLTRLQSRERGQKWIDLIGLTDFADSLPNTLSGGMRQRVGMARALVMEPAVLLLDEPFSALDYLTRLIWQREMETIWLRTKTTVLFVTHSVEEALMLGGRVIVMTSRPTRTKEVIEVNLARPRDSTSDEFNLLKRKILDSVIVEAEAEMARSGEKQISSVI
jgi:NitT/TauT family transport system ATP-binding protein